jgi:choloylglycine hydrolase
MSKSLSFLVSLMLLLLLAQVADACTSIRIKTEDGLVFFARTFEGGVDFQNGLAVVPKGTVYHGTLPDNTPKGLTWTTKYGMVGMTAFNLPLFSDGLNEKGLVVANLMFPGYAGYESFDPKQANITLANFELATWLLSNFATVAEVRQAIGKVRVIQGPTSVAGFALPLHFAVHDSQGDCLVIEYVKGKLHTYDNPLGVATNSPTFAWMTTNLNNYINLTPDNVPERKLTGMTLNQFGQGTGMLGLPGDYTPPSRFVRMVALTQAVLPVKGPQAGLNLAMTIINNVDVPKGAVRGEGEVGKKIIEYNQWTVAVDLTNKKYYFHTYDNKNWRYVDLTKALVGLKEIKNLTLEVPPDYPEVTATAK